MTAYTVNDKEDRQHQDVWAVLPWYVTGTLSNDERRRVEVHVAGCVACQTELERCRALATAVQTPLAPLWEPSAAHFTRLMARIDAADAHWTLLQASWERLKRWYTDGLYLLHATPPPVQWTLVVQGVLALLLASILVWPSSVPLLAPAYRTLSDGRVARPGDAHFRVVFTDAMTVREIHTLLYSIGGSIIQGPSSVGAYTVAVSAESPTQRSTVLTQLRTHPQVRLAEPLPRE